MTRAPKCPNALPASMMRPMERRAELCRLLTLGLVRLRKRERPHYSADDGEIPLHNSAGQSGHATPDGKETA